MLSHGRKTNGDAVFRAEPRDGCSEVLWGLLRWSVMILLLAIAVVCCSLTF